MKTFLKNLLKGFVLFLLKRMAIRKFRKFKGKVVAITGSMGKTSTKDAVYAVLNSQYKVKQSRKSMNTEFGLLLTILDIDSGYNSIVKWGAFLLKAFWHMLQRDYNEILLLEMGVDKPRDMDFLVSVVRPDIAIFTGVSTVHLENGQFADEEEIFSEKVKLLNALKDGGTAILNIDNERVAAFAAGKEARALAKSIGGEILTYGRDRDADFRATKVESFLGPGGSQGGGAGGNVGGERSRGVVKFLLTHEEQRMEVLAPVLGEHQIYALIPAVIVGLKMRMDPEVILSSLLRYSLPPGRMSVIEACVDGAIILDSSYNSSPEALKASLEVLSKLSGEKHRRIAVLGNMNELGERSEELHREIGAIIGKYCDVLITVGARARVIGEGAVEKGDLTEKTAYSFGRAEDAAEFYKGIMKKGDIILVKGSQNRVRLERFVKEIMARPEDAKNLLCRQEKVWEGLA